jgi:hypothetical protein
MVSAYAESDHAAKRATVSNVHADDKMETAVVAIQSLARLRRELINLC